VPELPEVETIRRGLHRRITSKLIRAVKVDRAKMVRGMSARQFTRALTGKYFARIDRRGKLFIVSLQGLSQYLLIHLKMTGQLIYQDARSTIAGGHGWPPLTEKLPNKYSHVIFSFSDGSHLYFNDMRQFGFVQLVNSQQLAAALRQFGLEPLHASFTWEAFRQAMDSRQTTLKAVLLNQAIIAGLGNIYADEVSFQARVRPQRPVGRLRQKELRALYRAIPAVLRRAVRYGGTTWRNYRDADGGRGNFTRLLQVYGRAGQPCKRCGSTLKRIKLVGRGTVYCPSCQR
jgi:formamidopyrimidine-DNA glycosylase